MQLKSTNQKSHRIHYVYLVFFLLLSPQNNIYCKYHNQKNVAVIDFAKIYRSYLNIFFNKGVRVHSFNVAHAFVG